MLCNVDYLNGFYLIRISIIITTSDPEAASMNILKTDTKAFQRFRMELLQIFDRVRKTTDRFRYRQYNYKMEARKPENNDMENVKQKFLQSYFSQDDYKGSLEDVEV